MHRTMATSCESLSTQVFAFFVSHRTPYKAAKPPKPILSRVKAKTHAIAIFFLSRSGAGQGRAGRQGARQGAELLEFCLLEALEGPIWARQRASRSSALGFRVMTL